MHAGNEAGNDTLQRTKVRLAPACGTSVSDYLLADEFHQVEWCTPIRVMTNAYVFVMISGWKMDGQR